MKLYKYSGTIEELAVERGRISYIKLFDVTDFDKAPTRLEVFGALGKYIEAIELTDAEERYIKSDWYFDSNLYLRRIEVPGVGDWPAKIITQSPRKRKSGSRAQATTSTSWRSSESGSTSKPASRSPCPARK